MLLVLALLVSLVRCGNTNDAKGSDSPVENEEGANKEVDTKGKAYIPITMRLRILNFKKELSKHKTLVLKKEREDTNEQSNDSKGRIFCKSKKSR